MRICSLYLSHSVGNAYRCRSFFTLKNGVGKGLAAIGQEHRYFPVNKTAADCISQNQHKNLRVFFRACLLSKPVRNQDMEHPAQDPTLAKLPNVRHQVEPDLPAIFSVAWQALLQKNLLIAKS
jgi:hypothetical protein